MCKKIYRIDYLSDEERGREGSGFVAYVPNDLDEFDAKYKTNRRVIEGSRVFPVEMWNVPDLQLGTNHLGIKGSPRVEEWDCYFGEGTMDVFSPRAIEVLTPYFGDRFTPLPVRLEGRDYATLYCKQRIDCLDSVASEPQFIPFPPRLIMRVSNFVFHNERLVDPMVFAVPDFSYQLYGTESIPEIVQRAGLRGFEFRLVCDERQSEMSASRTLLAKTRFAVPSNDSVTRRDWQDLFSSLNVTIADDSPPAAKPTIAQLAEYEAEAGFAFPLSYRNFIQVFGPGALGLHFNIMAPGYPLLGQTKDMKLFNSGFVSKRKRERSSNPFDFYNLYASCEPERIARLQYFAATSRGEPIGWDPNEVTDAEHHEYAIYIGLERIAPFRRLASTFKEFIFDVCLGDGYNRLFLDDPNDALMPVPYDRSCFRCFIDAVQ